MLNYKEAADIDHKYSKSILLHEGNPILVAGAVTNEKRKLCLAFYKVGKAAVGDHILVPVDDDSLADGPFKLGYFNGCTVIHPEDGEPTKVACFVTRAPIRRWKQGLSQENLLFQAGHGMNFNTACRMPEFADMIRGKYPTYKQAVKALCKEVRRVAFHRHWALGIGKLDQTELFYRGQIVGQGDDDKHLKLAPRFAFLKEAFEITKE